MLGQVNVDMPKGSLDDEKSSFAINSNDQLLQVNDYQNSYPHAKGERPNQAQLSQPRDWRRGEYAPGRVVRNQSGGGGKSFQKGEANVIQTVDRIKPNSLT